MRPHELEEGYAASRKRVWKQLNKLKSIAASLDAEAMPGDEVLRWAATLPDLVKGEPADPVKYSEIAAVIRAVEVLRDVLLVPTLSQFKKPKANAYAEAIVRAVAVYCDEVGDWEFAGRPRRDEGTSTFRSFGPTVKLVQAVLEFLTVKFDDRQLETIMDNVREERRGGLATSI